MRSAILGSGHFAPSRVVTNDDLAKLMTTSDEWIQQRTGIRERRYVEGSGVGSSDLAVPASQMADDLGPAGQEGVWQAVGSPLEAVAGADAVLILTEWSSFASLDWPQLAAPMRKPALLFDARSIADLAAAREAGLNVWRVGMG